MNKSYEGPNRRNGMNDRRQDSIPVCGEICKPIVIELDNRNDKLKEDLDRRDKEMHKKLDSIFSCLGTKVPSKTFWKVITGISILAFVVCGAGIAGTLWGIYGMVSEVKGSVLEVKGDLKAITVTVDRTASDLGRNLIRSDQKYDEFDRRLDKVEKGETFFNFYDKQHNKERKINP